MRLIDLVARASRSLKSAKLRTILTSLAIAVGGFTLTLTLAGSNGARQYADRLISSNFDPSELFVGRDKEVANTGQPNSKPQEYDDTVTNISGGPGSSFQYKRVTREDIDKLKSYPFVEQVRESFPITIQYVTREGQKKYTGSSEVYNPAQKPELKTGSVPATGDIERSGVLLPDSYLEPLGFSSPEDALGREISISVKKPFSLDTASQLADAAVSGGDPAALLAQAQQADSTNSKVINLKVVGISKKSATSFSFGAQPLYISGFDAKELYDFTTKGTSDYDKFLFVYARIKDGTDQSKIDEAEAALSSDGFYTLSSKDAQKAVLQIVDTLQIVVMVFGVITLIASVFGIVNTQYISVLERTREIGLMKALGMRRKDISRLFILEASWIGLLGGSLGALIALAVGTLLNPAISDLIGFDKGTYILIFNPVNMVGLVVALMLIAMIAGLLPAQKAAKLDPIEALRTE